MINLLTKKDIDNFNFYRNTYGSFRKDFVPEEHCQASVEEVLSVGWEPAKSAHLFKLLNNNLIIEKEVEYEENICSTDFKNEFSEIYVFLDKLWVALNRAGENSIREAQEKNYDTSLKAYSNIRNLQNLTNVEIAITPKYEKETFSFVLPKSKKLFKLEKGSRVMRAYKVLFEELEIEDFEKFRILVSQIINRKKIKGTLCLSIHPLDYLTMSDNGCNWSSCMSWRNKGCYRQGTVEMMNSKFVVVAYLKSSKDFTIPKSEFEWNNKKWRELFYVDENIIFPIKGYPYEDHKLEKKVCEWLIELSEKNCQEEFEKTSYFLNDYSVYEPQDNKDNSLYNIDCGFYFNYMYNDIMGLSKHMAYFSKKFISTGEKYLRINISGKTQCMWCGKTNQYFEKEDFLFCDNCEAVYYCENCGELITENVVEYQGYFYCIDCYNDLVQYCKCCGDTTDETANLAMLLPVAELDNYVEKYKNSGLDLFNIIKISRRIKEGSKWVVVYLTPESANYCIDCLEALKEDYLLPDAELHFINEVNDFYNNPHKTFFVTGVNNFNFDTIWYSPMTRYGIPAEIWSVGGNNKIDDIFTEIYYGENNND